jgi:hypothetical protein
VMTTPKATEAMTIAIVDKMRLVDWLIDSLCSSRCLPLCGDGFAAAWR